MNDGDEELPRGFIPLLVDEEVLVHQPRHQPLQVLQSSILVLFRASCSLEKLPVKSFRTLPQPLKKRKSEKPTKGKGKGGYINDIRKISK